MDLNFILDILISFFLIIQLKRRNVIINENNNTLRYHNLSHNLYYQVKLNIKMNLM